MPSVERAAAARMVRNAFALPALLAGSLLLAEPAGAADNLTICGLDFQIDEIGSADDKNDKVVLFGRTWLVPKAKLDVFVMGKYFERPEGVQSFGFDALAGCVNSTLENRQDEIAYRALAGLLTYPPQPGQVTPGFLLADKPFESRVSENFQRALIIAAGNVVNQSVAGPVLFQVALHNLDWTKRTVGRHVEVFAGEIKQHADSRFNQAIRAGNRQEAAKVTQTLGALFGRNDGTVRELIDRQAKIEEVLSRMSDDAGIDATIERLRADPGLLDLVAPQISEPLIAEAGKAVEAGRHERAIEILSMVDSGKYSAVVPQLLVTTLTALEGKESPVFERNEVVRLLEIMSAGYPQVKELYASRVDFMIRALLNERRPAESEPLFERLLALRPDPSAANDGIRIEQAKAYLSLGREEDARQKIKNVRGGTSIGTWLNLFLFWARAYVLLIVGILAFFAVLAVGLAIWLMRRSKPKEIIEEELQEEEESEVLDPLPKFVVSGLKETVNPEYREYVTCLKVFGLKPGADLAAIKNAYRKAVKAYHPDMNKKGEAMASEVFVEMTKTYERLLEIFRKNDGPPPRG